MSNNHLSDLELEKIIEEHDESETMEYKSNFDNSEQIGEYISALGNSALMFHQSVAYFIWGVKDKTKEIIGTIFNPKQKVSKANQMPMKTFLETFLDPRINLFWEEHQIKDKRVGPNYIWSYFLLYGIILEKRKGANYGIQKNEKT